MTEEIIKPKWSKNHDQCVHCGQTDRPHEGKGYCVACYGHHHNHTKALARKKRRRLFMSEEQLEKQRQFVRKWQARNREKCRSYSAQWRENNRRGTVN